MLFDAEKQYLSIIKEIAMHGRVQFNERTREEILVLRRMPVIDVDLTDDFPVLHTKKIWERGVTEEIAWIIRGETNIKGLGPAAKIWEKWADKDGELGPVYGKQFRDFHGVDQLQNLIDKLNRDPSTRQAVMTAWNPTEIPQMALPPCHGVAVEAFIVNGDLTLRMFQRSADFFVGVPFNLAEYALLAQFIAAHTNSFASYLSIAFGHAHLYCNHIRQVVDQLERNSGGWLDYLSARIHHNETSYRRPWVKYEKKDDPGFRNTRSSDFAFMSYKHYQPSIEAPVAK